MLGAFRRTVKRLKILSDRREKDQRYRKLSKYLDILCMRELLFLARATPVLGFLPQELLGTSMYEYYHHDDIPHLAESLKAALQTSECVTTQVISTIHRFVIIPLALELILKLLMFARYHAK